MNEDIKDWVEQAQKRLWAHDKTIDQCIWLKDMVIEGFKEIRRLEDRIVKLEIKFKIDYEN